MLIGYSRVSTQYQNLALQLDALKTSGCQKIFQEKVSSAKLRPQLQKMLDIVREGDAIVVWKLDRLGRSLIPSLKLESFSILVERLSTDTWHGETIRR